MKSSSNRPRSSGNKPQRKTSNPSFALRKDTIRNLTGGQLQNVAGGQIVEARYTTSCPSDRRLKRSVRPIL